jgi:hypothetical protein
MNEFTVVLTDPDGDVALVRVLAHDPLLAADEAIGRLAAEQGRDPEDDPDGDYVPEWVLTGHVAAVRVGAELGRLLVAELRRHGGRA